MRFVTQSGLLITGTVAAGLLSSSALAADIEQPGCVPAVSGINGKLEGAGGYIEDLDDGGRFHGVGTLSLPLGCLFGVQVDAGAGDLDGTGFWGVGGHFFMRDPQSYLLGVHAQYIDLDGFDILRIGPEAELYLGNITLSAFAGLEDAEGLSDDVIANIEAAFYVTEDFKLSGGYRRFLNVDAGALGVEFQPGLGYPVSLFADAMIGSDDYTSIMGGIRIYFGGDDKSLMARHREDDPPHLFNLLRQVGDGGIGDDDQGCPVAVDATLPGCEPPSKKETR
jgi:opacity protein-like surface antigen